MSPNSPSAAAGVFTETPEAFAAASRLDMERARAEVARLQAMAAPRDPEQALAAYDAAMAALSDAANRASVCRNAHASAPMREVAERCEQEIDALATELSLDPALYAALAGLDAAGLDPATRYYLEKTLRDFRRAGVDRDEPVRARVKALKEELVKIGQEFGNHIKDDVRKLELDPSELEGLPPDFIAAHPPGANGKVVLTTDNTDYVPFITYARSARARESLWRLYRLRGHPHNLAVLSQMLKKRAELASLLGYDSWAAYATEDKMIGSAQQATDFVQRIAAASGTRSQSDYRQLLERKRKDEPGATEVFGWDSAYYTERVKAEQYGFDAQSVRPYFEYRRVKQGVLNLTGELFGLSYERLPDAASWDAEVEVYRVREGEREVGLIYLDMHPREGKYKHYAQFPLINGFTASKGERRAGRLPEGALICNFPRPSSSGPALMEYSDVRTFFHEFGHLLHHVLGGHTRWAGLSGVATEWDFVEAPSQLLEEWVWSAPALRRFATHLETGVPIPEQLIHRAKAASEFGKGLWVRQQMFYAALSLEYHQRDPSQLDTTRLMAELQEKLTPFRHVEGTFFQESFGHLDGYSAIYYTYMWSLVIAKDLFSVFKKEGLLNPEPARRYRRAVLEPGGSKPAAQLSADFLGRPYDFAAYEEWLNA